MNDYQPLNPKDIERGYFVLTHRPLIKKILIGTGVFLVLLIYALAIWNFIEFIKAGTFSTMAQQANWTYDWTAYHQSRQPRAIKNSPAQFFSVASRKYNLVAVVENPNEDWAITSLDYTFIINDQELESQTAFINPGEKRLLTKMGYEVGTGLSKVEIKIDNIEWYRVENDLPEINFEVKEAKSEVPKTAWETVSAFSNTAGGWIVFGVKKTGKEYFGNFGKLMNEQKPNKLETSVQS